MLAAVLIDLQKYQTLVMYPFGENPVVQKFLDDTTFHIMDEEELYTCSKLCEGSEELTLRQNGKFSLKSPRHKSKNENQSMEKFDFNPPRASQS